VRTIVNGIDVPRFAVGANARKFRTELGVENDVVLLGVVARLTPEKDHETLLRAFARILSQHSKARLVIVGDGPLRHDLEIEAVDLKITSSVDFLAAVKISRTS